MVPKLSAVVKQAQEVEAQIKARMANESRRDHALDNWTDRRARPERRKRQRA